MAYYDIYPPLVQLDKKVTVPEMRTTVLEALKPLGPDYVALLAQGDGGANGWTRCRAPARNRAPI